MQDRYTCDVRDCVKQELVRAIAPERSFGIARHRYTDDGHNGDGRSSYEALNVPRVLISIRRAWRTSWLKRGLDVQC